MKQKNLRAISKNLRKQKILRKNLKYLRKLKQRTMRLLRATKLKIYSCYGNITAWAKDGTILKMREKRLAFIMF